MLTLLTKCYKFMKQIYENIIKFSKMFFWRCLLDNQQSVSCSCYGPEVLSCLINVSFFLQLYV